MLERARSGASATLGLIGEPGIGKTVLLDHAAERAAGMQVLRARGIESEAQIPFASLLELLRPTLSLLETIPSPQAVALEGALALRPGPAQERFAIGAATLSLLAAYAEHGPGGGADRRRPPARRLQRPGAAVRLPPSGGRSAGGADRRPRGRAFAARRRRPADVDDRWPQPRGGRRPARRPHARCRRPPASAPPPATRWRCSSSPPTPAISPSLRRAPRCWSPRGSRAPSSAGSACSTRTPGARWCWPRPATAATCRCWSGPRTAWGSTSRPWSAPRAPGWSRSREATVEFRHPLVRSAIYASASRRPAARGPPGARRRPARPRRRPPGLAPGRRGGRHRRVGVGGTPAGRRAGPGAQRLRHCGGRVRARGAAHRRQRAPRAAAARGGRRRLARRPGRAGRRPAR